ncbi:hypothetical protein ACLB2K_031913 [Fragaria x ananassa]
MKLSTSVTVVAVTGIENPIREAVAFSPPILFQQHSSMKADITKTSGMTMRSSGHRFAAERRPDNGGAIRGFLYLQSSSQPLRSESSLPSLKVNFSLPTFEAKIMCLRRAILLHNGLGIATHRKNPLIWFYKMEVWGAAKSIK